MRNSKDVGMDIAFLIRQAKRCKNKDNFDCILHEIDDVVRDVKKELRKDFKDRTPKTKWVDA